jgi:hypothetical protein
MVVTSSSLASRQKSMPLLRQKALVHCEHEEDAARRSGCWKRERRVRAGLSACCGPRGMMVLFLKHVHLQNVGAARGGG